MCRHFHSQDSAFVFQKSTSMWSDTKARWNTWSPLRQSLLVAHVVWANCCSSQLDRAISCLLPSLKSHRYWGLAEVLVAECISSIDSLTYCLPGLPYEPKKACIKHNGEYPVLMLPASWERRNSASRHQFPLPLHVFSISSALCTFCSHNMSAYLSRVV